MDERAFWIWVQHAFKPGSRMPLKLNSQYPGGLREFFEGGPRLWNSRRDIRDSEAFLLHGFTPKEAEARLEYAQKVGWQVIAPGSRDYPELLANIPDPPAVLYCKGTLPDLERTVSVAIVGARKARADSVDFSRELGFRLAVEKVCVVSGGAVGIDAGALYGALQVPEAKMISVLPVSLDSDYVLENSRLRSLICQSGGALVTEYFSQQRPDFGGFLARNRLITGLSRGVVIVQAAKKSGSMIYAARAVEQNRDVFVYPGPEGDAAFAGSRELLEDGAKAVLNGEDVLEEYRSLPVWTPAAPAEKVKPERPAAIPVRERSGVGPALRDAAAQLTPEEKRVWEALGSEPAALSQLAEQTGLAVPALLSLLTRMELEGLAVSLPGKRYTRGVLQ